MVYSSYLKSQSSRAKIHPNLISRESSTNGNERKSSSNNDENNDDESDENNGSSDDDDDESSNLTDDKQYLTRLYFTNLYDRIKTTFSIQKLQSNGRWLLDIAHIDFRVSFDDLSFALTLYVLFAPSIVFLTTSKDTDYIFTTIMVICFSFFILENIINTFSKTFSFRFGYTKMIVIDLYIFYLDFVLPRFFWEGYFCSYMWFLDIIVIISLFPDVPAIANSVDMDNFSTLSSEIGVIIRILRLFRLIKVYSLLRAHRLHDKERLEVLDRAASSNGGAVSIVEELEAIEKRKKRYSKLGDQLAEFTTTRVIFLILILLVIIPLFIHHPKNASYTYSTAFLQGINTNSASFSSEVDNAYVQAITSAMKIFSTPVLYMEISQLNNGSAFVDDYEELNKLRDEAIISSHVLYYNTTSFINYFTSQEFSINYYLREQALNTILLIIFVGLIFLTASFIFTRDTENLVLKPIERMMKMVEAVAINPLAKIRFGHDTGVGSFETNLLEKTFVKIAGLLRVCFGEAGAGIIKANLKLDPQNPSTSIINPLLPGIRVYCIIGFCDIHHFDFVLKKLGKDVLTFVNTIAAVVHERVHTWEGSCNKNLGNAFVLIWRIGEESALAKYTVLQKTNNFESNSILITGKGQSDKIEQAPSSSSSPKNSPFRRRNASMKHLFLESSGEKRFEESQKNLFASSTGNIQRAGSWSRRPSIDSALSFDLRPSAGKQKYQHVDLRRLPGVDKLAAKALIGFLKVISDLNRNDSIHRYHADKRLEKDGNPFRLQMGFGLHAGWAIEGAVGSLQKVDATYLSPHVNMAARLETASRQYGVPLLVSQNFYELLSPPIQKLMRRLDIITVKGSETAIEIYTYDTLLQLKKYFPAGTGNRRGSVGETNSNSNHAATSNNGSNSPPRKEGGGGNRRGSAIGYLTSLVVKGGGGGGNMTSNDASTMTTYESEKNSSTSLRGGNLTSRKVLRRHSSKSYIIVDNESSSSSSNTAIAPMLTMPSDISNVSSKSINENAAAFSNKSTGGGQHLLPPVQLPPKRMSASEIKANTTGTSDLLSKRLIRKKSEYFARPALTAAHPPEEVFESDRDVVYLRSHIESEFIDEFTKGVNKYIIGDWTTAKECLEKSDEMMKNNSLVKENNKGDGPSQTLLKYMASFDYRAPLTWQGYRPLTSK